jgi:hypothetical protein
MDRHHTPTSDYLQAALRESLKPVLVGDREYQEVFDRFEYLLALVHVDQKPKSGWAPIGCFGWRDQGSILPKVEREINEQGVTWPPIALFGGSLERLQSAREVVGEVKRRSGFW